jgi:hypothetical protein
MMRMLLIIDPGSSANRKESGFHGAYAGGEETLVAEA